MPTHTIQRLVLLCGLLAAGWMTFISPPRVLINPATRVDAAPYCRADTNRLEAQFLPSPRPRRADGTIDWSVPAPPRFDWTARYDACMADATVDTPRLALQLLVVLAALLGAHVAVRSL